MADKWEQFAVAEPEVDKWEAYAVLPDLEADQEIAGAQQMLVDPLYKMQAGPVKSGVETAIQSNPALNLGMQGIRAMQPGQINRALMNKATDNYSGISNEPMLPAPAQPGPSNLQDLMRTAFTQGPVGLGQAGYAAAQPHITPRNAVGGLMDIAVDPLSYVGAGGSKPVQQGLQSLKTMAAPTVEQAVDDVVMKLARPNVSKLKTMTDINRYKQQFSTAVKSILRNRGNIGLVDEIGGVSDRLPQSLEDMSQAINATKKNTFKQYDQIAQRAGEAGVKIDLSALAKEYIKVAENPAVRKVSPEMSQWALNEANKYMGQKVSPSVAQDIIELYNQELKAFYRNPTSQFARKAAADAAAVSKLRQMTDEGINSAAGGPAYQAFKNEYGALRTIEDDMNRRLAVHARKTGAKPFGMDIADVFAKGDMLAGILTANPAHLAQGAAKEGIIQWLKLKHNPDKMVKRLFEKADEAVRLGKSNIDLPRVKPQPRLGVTPTRTIPTGGPAQLPPPTPNQAVPTDQAVAEMLARQNREALQARTGMYMQPQPGDRPVPNLQLPPEPQSPVVLPHGELSPPRELPEAAPFRGSVNLEPKVTSEPKPLTSYEKAQRTQELKKIEQDRSIWGRLRSERGMAYVGEGGGGIPREVKGQSTTGKFYHVTDPDHFESIKENGLIPGKSKPFGQVFESDMKANYGYEDIGTAVDHAKQGSGMLIRVDFPEGVDPSRFTRSVENDLVYTDEIPPNWIKIYSPQHKQFVSIGFAKKSTARGFLDNNRGAAYIGDGAKKGTISERLHSIGHKVSELNNEAAAYMGPDGNYLQFEGLYRHQPIEDAIGASRSEVIGSGYIRAAKIGKNQYGVQIPKQLTKQQASKIKQMFDRGSEVVIEMRTPEGVSVDAGSYKRTSNYNDYLDFLKQHNVKIINEKGFNSILSKFQEGAAKVGILPINAAASGALLTAGLAASNDPKAKSKKINPYASADEANKPENERKYKPIVDKFFDMITDAIVVAEGNPKNHGVLSEKTDNPLQVVRNSVRNNYGRWLDAGMPEPFISFMQKRWAPIGAKNDPNGLNKNWTKNVDAHFKKQLREAQAKAS